MIAEGEPVYIVDEVVGISLAASLVNPLLNLLIIEIGNIESVDDVVNDGARKEHRLLLNDSNLIVVPLWVKVSQVLTIEENASRIRIVKALNQRNDCAFTAPTVAANCNDSVSISVNREGDAFQNLD